MLERFFKLSENHTTVKTESLAGLTTFLTMAYIIFVQPAVLAACGMNPGAVFVASCLSTAFITIIIMPFSGFSITEGIAFGFISFTVIKLFSGKRKDIHWLIAVFSILFVIRYLFI